MSSIVPRVTLSSAEITHNLGDMEAELDLNGMGLTNIDFTGCGRLPHYIDLRGNSLDLHEVIKSLSDEVQHGMFYLDVRGNKSPSKRPLMDFSVRGLSASIRVLLFVDNNKYVDMRYKHIETTKLTNDIGYGLCQYRWGINFVTDKSAYEDRLDVAIHGI